MSVNKILRYIFENFDFPIIAVVDFEYFIAYFYAIKKKEYYAKDEIFFYIYWILNPYGQVIISFISFILMYIFDIRLIPLILLNYILNIIYLVMILYFLYNFILLCIYYYNKKYIYYNEDNTDTDLYVDSILPLNFLIMFIINILIIEYIFNINNELLLQYNLIIIIDFILLNIFNVYRYIFLGLYYKEMGKYFKIYINYFIFPNSAFFCYGKYSYIQDDKEKLRITMFLTYPWLNIIIVKIVLKYKIAIEITNIMLYLMDRGYIDFNIFLEDE